MVGEWLGGVGLTLIIYIQSFISTNFTCGEDHHSRLLCSKSVLLQNKVLGQAPIVHKFHGLHAFSVSAFLLVVYNLSVILINQPC